MSTELAHELHDKATRGQRLSTEAQDQLVRWYERLDAEESAVLDRTLPPSGESLRNEIDKAVAQLLEVTQRVQNVRTENDVLRKEIAALQRQLASRRAPQLA